MRLRDEAPADFAEVEDLVRCAFGASGAEVAGLVKDLRGLVSPASGISLVAEDGGRLIGHAMFTASLLDAPRALIEVQVLSPLAVAPEWQRQGVGSSLVREGLTRLEDLEVPLVFLEGSPDYYSRFGFIAGHELGFRKPSLRIPDRAFQVVPLRAHEPWMTGTLVYSEVFWHHDAVGLRDGVDATSFDDRAERST